MPTGRPRAKTVYQQIFALVKGGSALVTPPSSTHDLSMNAAIDPEGMAAVTTSLTAGSLIKGKMSSSLSWRPQSTPCVAQIHFTSHIWKEAPPQFLPVCLSRETQKKNKGRTNLVPITAIVLRAATPQLHPPISI